jgi:serine/threonine protein kinase
MTEARACPQCGADLPVDAPEGLCPRCLLQQGIGEGSGSSAHARNEPTLAPRTADSGGPTPGSRLRYFGDYELLDEIARGGMGIVWKARQTSLKRDVALKMIRNGALAGSDEVARFLREAEAAANLQHPNIVAIHEVGEHGGQHYFSMDYVAGRDLGSLVKEGPLSPRSAARYVKIIAEAVHFAHQRGTLHRDLKPQNVLIDAGDQPRITDFGLAKLMKDDSHLTQSGVVMGSPSYMPPEQASGSQGDVGPASDVYSLGAILYELLTGRPPFRGSTPMATLCAVLQEEPTAPRRLKADVPPDLETICLKCLEKSPSARYPTARALAEDLDRFLNAEPIQARPASPLRKALSWARRHPSALAALAALVMFALAFSVFYLFEENAFLRAQHADPTLVRTSGTRNQSLQIWTIVTYWTILAGIYFFAFRTLRGVDASPREWIKPRKPRPIEPLGTRMRALTVGAGLVWIGCGLMLLVTGIEAHVWEGESMWPPLVLTYSSTYFGLWALWTVIRDYRLVHYGIRPAMSRAVERQLTAAQVESICGVLEDEHDWRAGIERYRQVVPDAELAEAKQYVIRLYLTLRAEHPEKFAVPPLSLATLNWNAVLVCAAIEAVVLGVLWFVMPPSHPVSAGSQFAYSFLFGLGLTAGLRVKGRWKRLLLLAPALAVLILSETILPRLVDASSHSTGTYVCGVLFGILLMASAFNPRRRRREAAIDSGNV